jgi:hypothetical protein
VLLHYHIIQTNPSFHPLPQLQFPRSLILILLPPPTSLRHILQLLLRLTVLVIVKNFTICLFNTLVILRLNQLAQQIDFRLLLQLAYFNSGKINTNLVFNYLYWISTWTSLMSVFLGRLKIVRIVSCHHYVYIRYTTTQNEYTMVHKYTCIITVQIIGISSYLQSRPFTSISHTFPPSLLS